MRSKFVHLHVHSEFSILDSACKINSLLDRAEEYGMDAIALTDHGVMSGAIKFYRQAKKRGIKPIIGCEIYVAPGIAGNGAEREGSASTISSSSLRTRSATVTSSGSSAIPTPKGSTTGRGRTRGSFGNMPKG
ncbi:hypothetical protein DRJ24_02455 [Candidatus Acetothermia bacterium]|nr:MAG: hypothetical protein DRJ24_02455 [Candidatus Acetothermia bacterium]